MASTDGMTHAPVGKPSPVCKPGEFVIAAAHLDHGHIYGQCNGLVEAGAVIKWVFDPFPERVAAFIEKFPGARPARSLEEILEDPEVRLVAAAAVPNERGPLGCRIMEAGKDYFTDKTPFTALEQLAQARRTCDATGRKYAVYFSERLHVECAVRAGQLVAAGAIGKVVQTIGTGPHRLSAPARPDWFFEKEKYGGILCDIGSHQSEQFLFFTGAKDARVVHSAAGNFANAKYPELEDFGECSLVADNGASGYYRVDWLTPAGLGTWGDGRLTILGTEGYIELRKYIDIATTNGGEQLLLVDAKGEHRIPCSGNVGFPFFGELILDCLHGTEKAMSQKHTFLAAELCLKAQEGAMRLDRRALDATR
jgi:predicted dehydrogenase